MIKRYTDTYDIDTDTTYMKKDDNGRWVRWEDVLAEHAEKLQAIISEPPMTKDQVLKELEQAMETVEWLEGMLDQFE